MDKSIYARAKKIFLDVCELAEPDRGAAVERFCGTDPELHSEVCAMLAADGSADLLATHRLGLGVAAFADQAWPERVGCYEIEGLLGQGGMGIVFRARQRSPDRSIALKILAPTYSDPVLLHRFELEGRLLGRLNHDGIARIHEYGQAETEQGICPFLAMELVEGRNLIEYADECRLDMRGRLAVVVKVCDAVAHAHRNGVIHRDLKPANILVTNTGQPKVVDFGIARFVDSEATRYTRLTAAAELVGTLAYMSPEQATIETNRDPDTRSDVYSLGVIIYRLVAKQMPYLLEGKTLIQAVETIRKVEPRRLDAVAPVPDDVATIVAKALSKEPDRRYSSASDLGADIERFLRDEAILARPPSAIYSVRKFARRHRVLVVSATAIALTVIGALIVSLTLFFKADRARVQAEAAERQVGIEHAASERRLEIATSAFDFLSRLLVQGDPWTHRLAGDDKVADAVCRAATLVDDEFAGAPLVRARVHEMAARVLLARGDSDKAERSAKLSLSLYRQREADPSPGVGRVLVTLAGICDVSGRDVERGTRAAAAHDTFERLGANADPLWRIAAGDMHAQSLILAGQAERGAEIARRMLAVPIESIAHHQRMQARLHCTLAFSHTEQGADEEALGQLGRARKKLEEIGETETLDFADVLHETGQARVRNDPAKALQSLTAARALRSVHLGAGHVLLAQSDYRIGRTLERLGRRAEAKSHATRAYQWFKVALGPQHILVAKALALSGELELQTGRAERAMRMLRKAVRMVDSIPTAVPVSKSEVRHAVAKLWVRHGFFDDAESAIAADRSDLARALGEAHPRVTANLHLRGALSLRRGRGSEAREIFREVLRRRRREPAGSGSHELGVACVQLAELEAALGLDAAAWKLYDEGLRILRRAASRFTTRAEVQMAELALRLGELGRAERLLVSCRERMGTADPMRARAEGLVERLRRMQKSVNDRAGARGRTKTSR